MTDREILEQLIILQKIDHAMLHLENEKSDLQGSVDLQKANISAEKSEFEEKKKHVKEEGLHVQIMATMKSKKK